MRPFLGYISLNTYWGEKILSCGVACKFFREFQGCAFYEIVTHAGGEEAFSNAVAGVTDVPVSDPSKSVGHQVKRVKWFL